MNRLTVAKITKPHGIKGEVRAVVYLDSPELFCRLKEAYIDSAAVKIKSSRVADGNVILRLDGVEDRNAAETLRGKELSVERSTADDLKNNKYFVSDLIGLTVIAGDEVVGKIDDIYMGTKSADVISIAGERSVMLPFLRSLNAEVDLSAGTIKLDEKAFMEIAVYEN